MGSLKIATKTITMGNNYFGDLQSDNLVQKVDCNMKENRQFTVSSYLKCLLQF